MWLSICLAIILISCKNLQDHDIQKLDATRFMPIGKDIYLTPEDRIGEEEMWYDFEEGIIRANKDDLPKEGEFYVLDIEIESLDEEETNNVIVNCDDSDPCTEDLYHPSSGGCLHISKSCDDDDPCTQDVCEKSSGSCIHLAISCEDSDPCTYDYCDKDSGVCLHVKSCSDTLPYISFSPISPKAGDKVMVYAHDKIGWVWVGMKVTGPCGSVSTTWKGVTQGDDKVFTWSWETEPLTGGTYQFTFTADNGTKEIVSATLKVTGDTKCGQGDICTYVGQQCEDHYYDTLVCSINGKSKPVMCHKYGQCMGIGGGVMCSWGIGSYCEDPCAGETPISQSIVKVSQGKFIIDNKELRFVGMNVRGLVHYGYKDILPYAPEDNQDLVLDTLKAMGARVARVFVANKFITKEESASRLVKLLNKAATRGIYIIAALTDFYPTGFCPKGDEQFYGVDPWGWTTLNQAFFAGGYKQNYLPLVQTVVASAKEHPAIFAWELGNEVKWPANPPIFYEFAKDVSAQIAAIDSKHLITAGLISTKSANMQSFEERVAFYSLPNLHFLTTHNYNGEDDEWHNDIDVATAVNKPLIIEEAGFQGNDRASLFKADMDKWFSKGAKGYMQWGFMPTNYDNGDGDGLFGMDKIWHNDWDALFNLYKGYASALQ